MHIGARYYEVETRRWAQKDSALGNVTNPLTLNRFTYVLNQPTNLYDEKGTTPNKMSWLDNLNNWFRNSFYPKFAALVGIYTASEDISNELTNPQPPFLPHDFWHLMEGLVLVIGGLLIGGGVIAMGAIIVGTIDAAIHAEKLAEAYLTFTRRGVIK